MYQQPLQRERRKDPTDGRAIKIKTPRDKLKKKCLSSAWRKYPIATEDRNESFIKWKASIKRLNIIKMSILSKLIYTFKAIPIEILTWYFFGKKLTLKFIRKEKHIRLVRRILKKRAMRSSGWWEHRETDTLFHLWGSDF